MSLNLIAYPKRTTLFETTLFAWMKPNGKVALGPVDSILGGKSLPDISLSVMYFLASGIAKTQIKH